MKAIYLLFLLLAINACIDPQQPENIEQYYDLSAKLNEKTEQLQEYEFTLKKSGSFGDFQENITLSKDSITSINKKDSVKLFFENEWELFYALDLNKQGKIGNYNVQKTDSSVQYTLKPDSDGKIQSLDITFFNKKSDVIHKISAETKDANVLYTIENKLTMAFMPGKENKVRLYEVKSDQQVKLQDRKQFSMRGNIIYK